MPTRVTLSHFFFFLLLVEITSTFNPSAVSHYSPVSSKPRGVVLNLIHRNSVVSRHYTPNATQWVLTREAIAASLARARSYSQLTAAWKNGGVVHANGGVPVLPDETGHSLLARIFVGQPPVEQLVIIDTGSSVTWIHCEPCRGCPEQSSALFNPRRSSTYSSIPCDHGSEPCEAVGGKCDDSQTRCSFKVGYLDGVNIEGDFAKETVVFGDLSVTVNTFGCAYSHTKPVGGPTKFQESGILGLGQASSSILGQFDHKFSYCIGNLNDPTYQYHKLFLGDAAKLDAPATPIVSSLYGFYYVDLEGINFNEVNLDIDSNVFKLSGTGEGGVVFDSGSTLTYLKRGAYDPLATAAAGFLDKLHERAHFMIGNFPALCYKGTVNEVIPNPFVTLHFNGGLEMELLGRSLFFDADDDIFCMSIVPSEEFMRNGPLNIIGSLAQQYYNIGFDGNAMEMHVQRADCKDV